MIGAAKTQMAGEAIPPVVYSVNLNPGSLTTRSSNGSATSSVMRSDVIGGVGPFEYLWTIPGSAITINTPTADSTTFTSGAFNAIINESATLTVTDTGNGNSETSRDAFISFILGSNL